MPTPFLRNIAAVVASLLLLSSCFQVVEEVTLKNDGTGEMQLTVNFSQSRSKLASIMLMDSLNGYKIPSEKDIQQFMNETVDYLNKSKGMLTSTGSPKNYWKKKRQKLP